MTIGIDSSRTTKPKLTGTEHYSVEIIRAMLAMDEQDRFILYAPKDPRKRLGPLPANAKVKIMPFGKLWSQVRLSWEMLYHKPDCLFVPSHTVPLIHPKNTVVTLHDLGFKHFPELYSPKELFYHNWTMKFSAEKAKRIIAPSEYTKNDLIKTYNLEPNKITVIYHGLNREKFQPRTKVAKKPYIFFIGRLEEKKNIIGMLRAYALLRKEKRIKHRFILAGSPGFGYEKIRRQIEQMPPDVRKDVIQLGYVDEAEYIKYLQEAEIFFFATFFEGFGLPLLEVMAAETPIVASNVTAMPEVAGKAAILVNPRNPLEMASALSRLINSKKARDTLIYRGRMRARLFSWEKAAQQTLEVIHSTQT